MTPLVQTPLVLLESEAQRASGDGKEEPGEAWSYDGRNRNLRGAGHCEWQERDWGSEDSPGRR